MMTFNRPITATPGTQHGVAVVVLLYGLSVFSVLSLTILRNAELDRTLHTADDPDLHVVLYAGGASSSTMVGRLNLPTIFRNSSGPDRSTEVRIPGAPQLDLAAELPDGWSYAVRLSPNARVCCDGGDNACGGVTWNDEITSGSVTPAVSHALRPAGSTEQLQFALSSLPVPADVPLDTTATASSAFLVRATRLREPPATGGPAGGASQGITCRLESLDAEVASGVMRLEPGRDERGGVTRISSGTLQLTYRRPAESR
jgi:hypothetical protein